MNSKKRDAAIIMVVSDNANLEFVFSASWSSDNEVLDILTVDLMQNDKNFEYHQ